MAADPARDYWSEAFASQSPGWMEDTAGSGAPGDVWIPTTDEESEAMAPTDWQSDLPLDGPWEKRNPAEGTWPIAAEEPDAPWRRTRPVPAPPWQDGTDPSSGSVLGSTTSILRSSAANDLSDLRDALSDSSARLNRQIDHQRQLEQQLAATRAFASEQSLQARKADTRIAQMTHELAAAREELANLRALEQGRTDRMVHLIEETNIRLVDQIRSGAEPSAAPVETGPTLSTMRRWLRRPGAVFVIDGEAIIAQVSPTDEIGEARRFVVDRIIRLLGDDAVSAEIVFDGEKAVAIPEVTHPNPPRILVTAPGVDAAGAIDTLISAHGPDQPVLAAYEPSPQDDWRRPALWVPVDVMADLVAGRRLD